MILNLILLLIPGIAVPTISVVFARQFRDARYDRVVLRTLLLACAGGWVITGIQLPRLAWPLTSGTEGPGFSLGPLWLLHVCLWAVFGWPAVPLTFVAMRECSLRGRENRTFWIPFGMIAICVASTAVQFAWQSVAQSARSSARREYIRQKQWEEDAPMREVQARTAELRKRQREKAAPWREQKATADFDGEKLIAVHFNSVPQCDLTPLGEMQDVKELAIVMTPLDEEDIDKLVLASQLERLVLVKTGFTDVDLSRLSQLRELREFSFNEDAISAEAVVALQIAMPNLSVYGLGSMGPRRQWTKQDWNSARSILGEEAFQQALRDAGLDGIPTDAPEGKIAPEENSAESQPAGTP